MATELQSREYALAETKRHKPCLIYSGHRYVQDKVQNRTIYWRCEDRSHCNGRAHQLVGNGSLPVLTIKHNHPPIIEDLARHDIVSVDSHRRRRRQTRKILSNHLIEQDDRQYPSNLSNMTSPVKRENRQNRQPTAMVKNLHMAEVITTAAVSNIHPFNQLNMQHPAFVDPIEMTKLLSNITTSTTAVNSSIRKVAASSTMDQPSRLNHFSWEEIEGRYLPVIFRNEHGVCHRYTSKTYVESTLFQSESWQRHLALARSLPPLVSYTYTEHELKLFRLIIEWHLASFHCKAIPTTDCLIRYEDLLEFYNTLRKLRDTISSATFKRPIAPLPTSSNAPPPKSNVPAAESSTEIVASIKKPHHSPMLQPGRDAPVSTARSQEQPSASAKESGWVQINNVFVPYIVKIKLRESELAKCHTRQPAPRLQREFYVPYEILIKCNIFADQEFSFKKFLVKATQQDFDILNSLITNINIFDEKVPEKTLLVNLYHVMVGLDRILYIKFLPTKQPRTQVNKYHANVLTHKGGALLMNGNKLIPYIVQNNRFYVPLLYTFHSLPQILVQAKRSARAPRQYEIDYINLLFIYFSIDTPPLTADTLLTDVFNIKCPNLQSPVHFRTLHEQQQFEKNKLSNTITSSANTSKPAVSSSKSNKCPPANVVVNPMIHHPSFYAFTAPKPVAPVRQAEIKTIRVDNQSLNAVDKSGDAPVGDWKISIRSIFQQFSFDVDYPKFIQWCQTNLLLPLIKLDDDERKAVRNNDGGDDKDDYYIYQRHLDRCISLLNDLKRGSITMTLLPSADHEFQEQQLTKASLAGAKKRKTTVPATRSPAAQSTTNELNSPVDGISQGNEYQSVPPPLLEECDPSMATAGSVTSPIDLGTCPIVSDNDDEDVDVNDDDDDIMPVVASVEEEQPLEDLQQFDNDTSMITADSSDCNEERIQLDDKVPSCSSGYESSAAFTNPDVHDDEEQEENTNDNEEITPAVDPKETSSTESPLVPMVVSAGAKRTNKKRQRYKYGKIRLRPRSITPRILKKPRVVDDDLSLVRIITRDQIEQHLRTLFMSLNDTRRTRTRSVKIPTRLAVDDNLDELNDPAKPMEPDSNVFDILSSSEPKLDMESLVEVHSPCTYNVIPSNTSTKLGVTIKKIVPADASE